MEGTTQDRDQVHRVTPGVGFLHAIGCCKTVGEAGQRRRRTLPARRIESLERLVGEIQDVTRLDVPVIGCGCKHHVGHLRAVGSQAQRGDDAPLGAVGVADLDKLPEPDLEGGCVGRRGRQSA